MASTVLTFHNGKLDTIDDLATALDLQEGQRLFVIANGPHEIILRRETVAARSMADALKGYKPDWRNLRGSLSFLSRSPNESLEEDRLHEFDLEQQQSRRRE